LHNETNYEVALIFSDVRDNRLKKNGKKRSKAKEIAQEYDIPYEFEDIRDFYREKGVKRAGDLKLRPEFDRLVIERIEPFKIDLIALAGYMSITSKPLLERYSGRIINVHPADLSIMRGQDRKYIGIHAVEEAILAGEKELSSTTHIVREKVDHGEILVISEPISVILPNNVSVKMLEEDKILRKKVISINQNKLKENGDWIIYPLTLNLISEGKFSVNGKGGIYFEDVPHAQGLRL
jgi:folate-dependent phosphoribosylglycinamide formyltransferase PurN